MVFKKGHKVNLGRKLSEEEKQNIQFATIKAMQNPEIRERMRDYNLEKFKDKSNHPSFGRKHSEVSKKIMSEKAKLRLQNKENHPMFGKHQNYITKLIHGKKMKDKWKEEGFREKMKNNKRGVLTEEGRNRISQTHKGKCFSDDHKFKLSLSTKRAWQKPEYRETKVKILRDNRKRLIMPLKDTSIEIKIQNYLKQLNIPFFTHQYMKEIEHSYQCDFFIPSMNLVIETDGNYWHNYPIGKEIDHIRTSELIAKGFKILRLWESDINKMSLSQFEIIMKGGTI